MAALSAPYAAQAIAVISQGVDTYLSHVEIFEDTGNEEKARWLLLCVDRENGVLRLHKSKRNSDGSFSIGKTWLGDDLRLLEILHPTMFSVVFGVNRVCKWRAENPEDQAIFVDSLVSAHRDYAQGAPLVVRQSASPRRKVSSANSPPISSSPANSSQRRPGLRQDRGLSEFSNSSYGSHMPDGRSAAPPPPMPSTSQLANGTRTGQAQAQARAATPPRPLARGTSVRGLPANPAAGGDGIGGNINSSINSINNNTNSSNSNISNNNNIRNNNSQNTPPSSRRPSNDRIMRASSSSSPPPPSLQSSQPPRASPSLSHTTGRGTPRSRTPAVPALDVNDEDEFDGQISIQSPILSQSTALLETPLVQLTDLLDVYNYPTLRSAKIDTIPRPSGAITSLLPPGIETQLQNELQALDSATIYGIICDDARVSDIGFLLDAAMMELDILDTTIAEWKGALQTVTGDIDYIEGQNLGLQVQTANQKELLTEVGNLLRTTDVPTDLLTTLNQESLESSRGVSSLQKAIIVLFKAIIAGKDSSRDFRAVGERMSEYTSFSSQFAKRLTDYLAIGIQVQISNIIQSSDSSRNSSSSRRNTQFPSLSKMDDYLMRYAGLVLYLREIEVKSYQLLCANFFASASELFKKEIQKVIMVRKDSARPIGDTDVDTYFSNTTESRESAGNTALRRAKTVVRSATVNNSSKRSGHANITDRSAYEAFYQSLAIISAQIRGHQDLVSRFLHISESNSESSQDSELNCFAAYFKMDTYFRRQSQQLMRSNTFGSIATMLGALGMVFGFVQTELSSMEVDLLAKDPTCIFSLIAAVEKTIEDESLLAMGSSHSDWLLSMLEKEQKRLSAWLSRWIAEQIKSIEQTKLTAKKRNGLSSCVQILPSFINRCEAQLSGMNGLPIRESADEIYKTLCSKIIECLQAMALQSESIEANQSVEEKTKLNSHVILVENMHYLDAEFTKLQVPALQPTLDQVHTLFEQNMDAYAKIALRKVLGPKIIDFFDGVTNLRAKDPSVDVMTYVSYNKSALKRILKEFSSKDCKKEIDKLALRVEKHFEPNLNSAGEEDRGPIKGIVWKHCELAMIQETERYNAMLRTAFQGSAVLEWNVNDVKQGFTRNTGST